MKPNDTIPPIVEMVLKLLVDMRFLKYPEISSISQSPTITKTTNPTMVPTVSIDFVPQRPRYFWAGLLQSNDSCGNQEDERQGAEAYIQYRDPIWDARLHETNSATDETLILPLFHQMTEEDQDYVIECINNIGAKVAE